MSHKDYEKAVELIEKNAELSDFVGKINLETIANAENILSLKFPYSYTQFLLNYGCGSFGSNEIYGIINKNLIDDSVSSIPNMVWYTITKRKKDFPHTYIPIYELGNGEITCLDTSRMNAEGECPVVSWYFGNSEDIYEDFGAFLLDLVQNALKQEKE